MYNELKQETLSVLKNIGNNLQVEDLQQGSYLNTLVRGLDSLNEQTIQDIELQLNNVGVITADEETLEAFGARKGFPRIKNKTTTLSAGTRTVSMSIEMFKYIPNESYKLYTRGVTVTSDIYLITFLQDIVFNTNLNKIYFDCVISLRPDSNMIFKTLSAGSTLKLDIPLSVKPYIKEISINVENTLIFSSLVEELDLYRSRIMNLLSTDNISNSTSIYSLLNKIPGVDQYFIDETTIPHNIVLMSNQMYTNVFAYEYLQDVVVDYIQGLIDDYKGYTSSFNFEVAKKVSYSLDFSFIESSNKHLLRELPDYISQLHSIKSDFIISKNLIEGYFTKLNVYSDFNVDFYIVFNGVKFPSKTPGMIRVLEGEYPYLDSITTEGVFIDVHA